MPIRSLRRCSQNRPIDRRVVDLLNLQVGVDAETAAVIRGAVVRGAVVRGAVVPQRVLWWTRKQ